jgi:hypothetical protein
MSNIFAPNGFQPVKRIDAGAWTDAQREYLIAAANTHKFFRGDIVVALTTGYIDRLADSGSDPTQGVLGVFMGCEYMSVAGGAPKWSPQFPGGDTAQDIKAYVIIDPMVMFQCWVGAAGPVGGGPAVQADIFTNFGFANGAGNTANGQSTAYLDYGVTSNTADATHPLTLQGLVKNPPGVNGTDVTSAGNMALVTLNVSNLHAGVPGV